jgi:formylglycine-generating enzyme required for sulfatase activity
LNANGYRLPTEAEWEYAAKGGKNSAAFEYSGGGTVDDAGWYNRNSGNRSREAATKAANPKGIYDMSGNVYEWCWDWYGSYNAGNRSDKTGASSGMFRVNRGGSWNSSASYLRSASRHNDTPNYRSSGLGFRIVKPLR